MTAATTGACRGVQSSTRRSAEGGDVVFTVPDGIAAQAASGATPADLRAVVDLALLAWPPQGDHRG